MLDIPFPKKFGEALVGDGLTGPHHILLESGWTTFYVDSEETVTKGVRLLRLSYLFNVARRPDRAPSVDIERELAQLDLTGETAGLFEKEIARRRPKSDVQSVP